MRLQGEESGKEQNRTVRSVPFHSGFSNRGQGLNMGDLVNMYVYIQVYTHSHNENSTKRNNAYSFSIVLVYFKVYHVLYYAVYSNKEE